LTVFVKPKEGLLVRDPKTKTPVPIDGMLVELNGTNGTYWRRRINDGDLSVINKLNDNIVPFKKEIKKGGIN
jgi:hypothetical protein